MHLSRRQLLVDGLRVTALVRLGSLAERCAGERVLVVVQLTGGNDGLNTIVPFTQDAYFRGRPTLALEPGKLVPLDGDHGFHPALGDLGRLFAEGRLSVVHGVGYPGPSRSHFRSMEIWHTAEPSETRRIGWLGRMADQIAAGSSAAMPALCVGDGDLPLALVGARSFAPTVRDESSLRLDELPGLAAPRESLLAGDGTSGDLAFLRAAARSAYLAARRLEDALANATGADYPDLGLARKLRLVARLVAGGFDTRLFQVSLGGFDTHARQAASHASLLTELGRSLSAFQDDLAAHGAAERVLTLVHSEFGRRVEENGSRGTDHGAAAPVLLLGGPVRGGVRGTPPDLEHLEDGDVGFSTDFRALYAAIERDWMGLAPSSTIPAFVPWA